ncbi:MAG: hypothetical protein WAZ12_03075 [Candidatus Absconditicoccaceae bacterium]
MSRKVFKDDIRVVIYPRHEGDFGMFSTTRYGTPESNAKFAEDEAERIVAEINRHVDFPGQVSTAYEKRTRCSHCGDVGELSSPGWWPECCDAERVEFYSEHATESDQWFIDHGMDDPAYLAEFRAEVNVEEA